MKRGETPSYRLTFQDAIDVWILHWNGSLQSRIAARFDVNQGRISEILKEKNHIGSRLAALNKRAA